MRTTVSLARARVGCGNAVAVQARRVDWAEHAIAIGAQYDWQQELGMRHEPHRAARNDAAGQSFRRAFCSCAPFGRSTTMGEHRLQPELTVAVAARDHP